jgi:hypothetical protein
VIQLEVCRKVAGILNEKCQDEKRNQGNQERRGGGDEMEEEVEDGEEVEMMKVLWQLKLKLMSELGMKMRKLLCVSLLMMKRNLWS